MLLFPILEPSLRLQKGKESMYRFARARAFTLIELLIVVGIIAILAAIAIPNMLEAQIRAKVSRAKSDMRTIATSLESYAVDNNKYPPNYDSGMYGVSPSTEYLTFAALTTPVAYITTAPGDVFRPDLEEPTRGHYFDYVAADSVFALPRYTEGLRAYYTRTDTKWTVISIGPDRRHDEAGQALDQAAYLLYDPTNGTVSPGDIVRSNRGQIDGNG